MYPSSGRAHHQDVEEIAASVPEGGVTYRLPLPPCGVDLHEYVKDSIKVWTFLCLGKKIMVLICFTFMG